MLIKYAILIPFCSASLVSESTVSGMLNIPVAMGTPPQDVSLTIDFAAYESSVFVEGQYGRNCYALVNCFFPSKSSSYISKSRKVSFFRGDSDIRTGSVSIDMIMIGSDDDQKTEFVFNNIDRSNPLSPFVPRDSTGIIGLNPRGQFSRSNLVVFDSNEDGSYQFSILPASHMSEMFSADGHTSVMMDTIVNDQINEWIIRVRMVPVRGIRHANPQSVDMVIDLNERGVVIHRSLQSLFIDSMFSDPEEYCIYENTLYTKCDSQRGGLFGFGIGSRYIDWPAPQLWLTRPDERVSRNGQEFCKTKVSFTPLPTMAGRIRIGKMLMQQLTTLALSAKDKRVFMEFVQPSISATRKSVIRLNLIQDPSPLVKTFDWPTIHEEESMMYMTFPANLKGKGEWCLFDSYARFIDDVLKIMFYRCDVRRIRRDSTRRMVLPGSDFDIDEIYRLRGDELPDESDDLVFGIPRGSEFHGSVEILESQHTMEIILRYGEASVTDQGSTEHENESDPSTGTDSDTRESGKKRSMEGSDDDSTSSDSGMEEKRNRSSDDAEIDPLRVHSA